MTISEMKAAIVTDLAAEISSDDSFDTTVLSSKVDSAVRAVQLARKYPSNYTDAMIEADTVTYYDIISKIALARYNRIGADDEVSHNENGISRTFVDEKKLFNGILPISRL